MKLAIPKKRIKTDGFHKVSKYEVEVNGFFFQLLYGDLYKDPEAAVIRELSTNAYDSHIQNGNPEVPFEVHLPNHQEPYFHVRDFGVGLDPEEMDTVYRHFNRSTKRDTNDQAGCLGLGSKTPLAYEDSFIVESIKHGVKHIYNIFKDDEGIPNLAQVNDEPIETDEPSGLKVIVAVKESDFYTFRNKAKEIYQYFPVHPTITGSQESSGFFADNQVEYVLEGNGWKFRSLKNRVSTTSNARIVMGPVYYPVTQFDGLTEAEQSVLSCDVDIFMDIGDVAIAPSRESLHMNPRTKRNITQRLKEIVSEVADKISDKLAKAKNLWAARCLYSEVVQEFPSALIRAIDSQLDLSNIKFKGQALFDKASQYGYGYSSKQTVSFYDTQWQQLSLDKFYYESGWNSNRVRKSSAGTITPSKNLVFYEKDLKTGSLVRCRKFVEDNNDKTVILLDFGGDDVLRDSAIKHIGIDENELFKTSSLPTTAKPKVVKGTTQTTNKPVKVCSFDVTADHNSKQYCWDKELDVDLSQGGFYIELYRYDAEYDGKAVSNEHLKMLLAVLNQAGYPVTTLYGMRADVKKKVNKMPKWINIMEYARKKLAHFIQVYPYMDYLYIHNHLNSLEDSLITNWYEFRELVTNLPDESRLKDVHKTVSKFKIQSRHRVDFSLKVKKIVDLVFNDPELHEQESHLEFVKNFDKFKEETRKLMKGLKLLKNINLYRISSDKELQQLCVEYIEFIESKENK